MFLNTVIIISDIIVVTIIFISYLYSLFWYKCSVCVLHFLFTEYPISLSIHYSLSLWSEPLDSSALKCYWILVALKCPARIPLLGSLWGPPRHSHIHPLLSRCLALRNPNSNGFDWWLLQVFLAGGCIDLQKRTPFCWTFFNHCDYFYLLPELKLKRAISNIMWKPRRIPSEISVNVQTYRAW